AALARVRGIELRGRVTHGGTGAPLADVAVTYYPLSPNPALAERLKDTSAVPCAMARTGPDGSYSLAVLPGPGVVTFQAPRDDAGFMPDLVTGQQLRALFDDQTFHGNEDNIIIQAGPNSQGVISQSPYHRLLLIKPEETSTGLRHDGALRPGLTRAGRVVGPGGQPLRGAPAVS